MDKFLLLPSGVDFLHYCLDNKNDKRIQTFIDSLLDLHASLPSILETHLETIKSYLSGGQSFEDFCQEGKQIFQKQFNSIIVLFSVQI